MSDSPDFVQPEELSIEEHVAALRELEQRQAELARQYGERYVNIVTVYGHRPALLAKKLGVTDASVVKRRDRYIGQGLGAKVA